MSIPAAPQQFDRVCPKKTGVRQTNVAASLPRGRASWNDLQLSNGCHFVPRRSREAATFVRSTPGSFGTPNRGSTEFRVAVSNDADIWEPRLPNSFDEFVAIRRQCRYLGWRNSPWQSICRESNDERPELYSARRSCCGRQSVAKLGAARESSRLDSARRSSRSGGCVDRIEHRSVAGVGPDSVWADAGFAVHVFSRSGGGDGGGLGEDSSNRTASAGVR